MFLEIEDQTINYPSLDKSGENLKQPLFETHPIYVKSTHRTKSDLVNCILCQVLKYLKATISPDCMS